ncbi:hypothetical protein AUK22_09630 [bacterium CG2_30_54_10]|nr:MAG: hypothetical protein AUK22_09630 [bacterium CG2_30_54_10]
MPGDVVIWSLPSGKSHGHIGVCCKNGNSVMAMNHSSSQRKLVCSRFHRRKPDFSRCLFRVSHSSFPLEVSIRGTQSADFFGALPTRPTFVSLVLRN